jgi:hypothetical protein
MHRLWKTHQWPVISVFLVAVSVLAKGQTFNGGIRGSITDPSGAVSQCSDHPHG